LLSLLSIDRDTPLQGLCGLSRFSVRSLVAVPVFIATAVLTSVAAKWEADTVAGPAIDVLGGRLSFLWPPGSPASEELTTVGTLALVLAVPWALLLWLSRIRTGEPILSASMLAAANGLWCGTCFGVGLSYGGMVRPSVVFNALNVLAPIDLTLWLLFGTALVVTFALYRVAQAFGVAQANALGADPGTAPPKIDRALVLGAALFGIAWGIRCVARIRDPVSRLAF
jgi:hypothetical protein